jgi:hypothetical protein
MFVKTILTVIITAFIVFVLINSDNPAGMLLSRAADEIQNYLDVPFSVSANRTMSFEFSLDRFPENLTTRARNINITMSGDLHLKVNGGNITTKDVTIYDYTGKFVAGKLLTLDGTFQKIKLGNTVIITKNGELEAYTGFNEVRAEGLEISNIKTRASGKVKIKGTQLFIDNEYIEIIEPKGRFIFSSSQFSGVGKCESAKIGDLIKG